MGETQASHLAGMVCRGKWSGTASYLCCSHGGGVGAFRGLVKENSESLIMLYVCVGCNSMDNIFYLFLNKCILNF